RVKAKQLHDNSREQEVVDDLMKALEVVNTKVDSGKMVHDPVTVGLSVLDEVVGPNRIRLKMYAIAPSGRSRTNFIKQLGACFNKVTPGVLLAEQINGVKHNEISSAFVIEYGAQRIVLGGDMES